MRIVRLSWHPTRDLQSKNPIHHGRINVFTLNTRVMIERGATRGEKKKGIKIKNSRLKHKRDRGWAKMEYAQGREEKKGRRSAL